MREITKLRKRRFPIMEADGTGNMNKDTAGAIPNASWYPKMDVYGHYRSMVMAASFPDPPKIPPYGPMADHPFSAGYSQADQDIIDSAAKLCGFPVSKISKNDSIEPVEVHRVSPVHNWRAKKT